MKRQFAGRGKGPVLEQRTAEQILDNVFTACGRDPNTVPLEALVSYSNYRKERYALQKGAIILVLTLFMMLPLLFVYARLEVRLTNPGNHNPVYSVSVEPKIPIRHIQAELCGNAVPVYEAANGEYTIAPGENGSMNICVTLLNRQITELELCIENVDTYAPELLYTEFAEEHIYLYVQDAGAGVDYQNIRILNENGQPSVAFKADAAAGCVALEYPELISQVEIPDLRGNILRIELKPQ